MAQPIPGSTLEDYKKLFWIIPVIIVGGLAVVGYAFYQIEVKGKQASGKTDELCGGCGGVIFDFQSCVDAGNPVMESHPRQCRANGNNYVEKL